MRTFDDFTGGEELDFGQAAFELDEMIAFAERWDPQLFHTDPEAAAERRSAGSSRAAGRRSRQSGVDHAADRRAVGTSAAVMTVIASAAPVRAAMSDDSRDGRRRRAVAEQLRAALRVRVDFENQSRDSTSAR